MSWVPVTEGVWQAKFPADFRKKTMSDTAKEGKNSHVSDKLTKWKIFVTSDLVTTSENKKVAHWPGRDQCYQEHLDILLCLLSIALMEEVVMKCIKKLSFSEEMKEKKNSPWFCCMIIRWTEVQDFNGLKVLQKKLPAQSFFQSHWRFEPLSYLRVHITSLNSILLIFVFCIARHCFSRLTKHHIKHHLFFCLLSSLRLLR